MLLQDSLRKQMGIDVIVGNKECQDYKSFKNFCSPRTPERLTIRFIELIY